jgi:phosphoglycerol transferase MdoB-like AlkP superfamily enzyme
MEVVPNYVWIIFLILIAVYVIVGILTHYIYNPPTQHTVCYEGDYIVKEDGLYYKSYLSKKERKIGGVNDPRIKNLKSWKHNK